MSFLSVGFILVLSFSYVFNGSSGKKVQEDTGQVSASDPDMDTILAIDELYHILSKRDIRAPGEKDRGNKKIKKEKKKPKQSKKPKTSLKGKNKKTKTKGKKKKTNTKGKKKKKTKTKGKKKKTKPRTEKKTVEDSIKTEKDDSLDHRLSVDCDECVPTLAKYARMYEGKAGAIFRQYKRIKSFEKLRQTKKDKKGDFVSSFNIIFQALGSDLYNPTCDGEPIAGNSALQPIADAMVTLGECEASIDSACPSILTEEDNNLITNCYDSALIFRSSMSDCLNPNDQKHTSSSICSCISSIDSSVFSTLQSCNIQPISMQQKEEKEKCVSVFMGCKSAEDATISGLDTCLKPYVCAGVSNPTEAKRELEILVGLRDSLYLVEFCHGDAMAELNLASGTGDDGVLPSNKKFQMLAELMRKARQTSEDGQECQDLEKLWETFNVSATATVQTLDGSINETAASLTESTLQAICGRNLIADLSSCEKESNERIIPVSVTVLIIRIRQWLLLLEIKITVITATFGLPVSPPPTPPPGTAATTTPTYTVVTESTARKAFRDVVSQLKRHIFK